MGAVLFAGFDGRRNRRKRGADQARLKLQNLRRQDCRPTLHLSHRRNESVAHLGNRLDVSQIPFFFAHHFAEKRDRHRQVSLFHKAVRPHRLHDLVLGEQPARVLHQEEKQLEGLGSERHGSSLSRQPVFGWVQAKRAVIVETPCFQLHRFRSPASKKSLQIIWKFFGGL